MATSKTSTTIAKNKELEDLKKENEQIKKQMEELMALMKMNLENKVETPIEVNKTDLKLENLDTPVEPNYNQMVRIVSMCCGVLSLKTDSNNFIVFDKFGETKPVLYSKLIDIVNNNRIFAEKGVFYILDKNAVYYLGLTDFYSKLADSNTISNIHLLSDKEIESIISTFSEREKDTMVLRLCDRIYKSENVDYNKIALISRLTGVDILSKVEEMRRFEFR